MKRRIRFAFLVAGCLWTLCPGSVGAEGVARQSVAVPTACVAKDTNCLRLTGNFLTQLHLRNDSDFDGSSRFDDLDGQTDGQVATFFAPRLTIAASGGVTVNYELELGWNAWGRNDPGQPNQFGPSTAPGLAARHKVLWAGWQADSLELKAGFQTVRDPSGLFLDHTTGVVTANVKFGKSELRALAGQMAETTHEGLDVGRDNFLTDSFLVGLSYRTHLGDHLRLDGAAYTVLDHRLVGRPFVLNTAVLGLSTSRKNYQAWLHILGQVGKWTGGGLAGRDEKISSYAAQVGMSRTLGRFGWSVNLFALSPDDDHHGNGVQSAFFGSGKNRSRSILMTEDETRDRYDNLDERMGSRWGALIYSPAGLAVADLGLGYQVTTVYTSSVIIAVGSTINPKRSLGARHVGVELAFLQDFQVSRNAAVFLNGLLFLPGTAAGAFVNDIDRSATQTMYGGTAGFRVKF